MSQPTNKLQGSKDLTPEQRLELAQAMLDASFDDIQDLAKFVKPPRGSFYIDNIVKCEIGMNQDSTDVVIQLIVEIGDTLELASMPGVVGDAIPAESKPPVGSLFSVRWTGAMGIQKFKGVFEQVIKSIDPNMSPRTLVEMLGANSITGMSMMTTLRADKEKVEIGEDGVTMVPVTYAEITAVMAV